MAIDKGPITRSQTPPNATNRKGEPAQEHHLLAREASVSDVGTLLIAQRWLATCAGEEMYMALDKGPINPQHVLLLPIEHRSNSLALSAGAFSEMERYLSALRTCFASQVPLLPSCW